MIIPGVPDAVLLLPIAAIVAVVAVILVARRIERQREAGFQQAARHSGWNEEPGAAGPPREVAGFRLFNQGRARRAMSVFRGRPGQFAAALFEYRYTVGGGKNSHTYRQTVMAFELPRRTLPAFELRPEGVFHKIGAAFGYQDIDLENMPEFSKLYLLRGADEGEIRRTFHHDVAYHFEKHPGWSVEAEGGWIVVYRLGKRVKPEALREFVQDADQIASVLGRG